MNVDAGGRDKLFLSGYFGRDVIGLGTTLGIDWGNATGTVRWNHIYSPRWFSNTSLIYSNYNYGVSFETQAHDFTISSVVRDINRQGVTVLLVEQNAEVALRVSHYAYVMESGAVVKHGPSDVFLHDPDIKKAYLGL